MRLVEFDTGYTKVAINPDKIQAVTPDGATGHTIIWFKGGQDVDSAVVFEEYDTVVRRLREGSRKRYDVLPGAPAEDQLAASGRGLGDFARTGKWDSPGQE